jgi:hypothetical protein
MKPINLLPRALTITGLFLVGCSQGFDLVSVGPKNTSSNTSDPDDTTEPVSGDPVGDTANPADPTRRLLSATFSNSQVPQLQSSSDILFIVDNSGSMSQEQQRLGENFQSFINGLTSTNNTFSYQLGITSTDFDGIAGVSYNRTQAYTNFLNSGPGGLISRFLNPANSTPRFLTSSMDPEFIRSQFIASVNLGTGGSGAENGLETLALALSGPLTNPGKPNHGFIRGANVRTDIVIVSDEDAHDPQATGQYLRANPARLENYLNEKLSFLATLKDGNGANMIKIHSIVGFENSPSSCALFQAGPSGQVLRGEGVAYLQASARTEGMRINLCNTESFASDLLTLGSVIGSTVQRVFSLAHQVADTNAIKVFVNGNQIPMSMTDGFTYTPSSNSVRINGLDLENLATIDLRIEYTYWSSTNN